MPSFLVESYYTGASATALDDARAHARRAAELGSGIRYVRTTFLPGDETIMHLFEAPSIEELEAAGRRAALSFERIVEAIEQATPAAEEAL